MVGSMGPSVYNRAMSGRRKPKPAAIRQPAADKSPASLAAAPAGQSDGSKPPRVSKASARRKRAATALEDRIGHHFTDSAKLEIALTHISALRGARNRAASYQRLEFLGDHVLGLVISDMLFRAFARADEGEMSRRLADLVRKEACADVGRAIGLGAAIRLGASEANAGGRGRTHRAAVERAHAHAGAAATRFQDRAAGMGAGAGAADTRLS